MRRNSQDFVSGFEEEKRKGMCSFLKFLPRLTWETTTLLTERGNTGVTGFYGGDNRFGFGNFDLEVLRRNLVVAIL